MDQDSATSATIGSTQTEFLRHLPQDFEDLVEHWHIVRKRSCPLQEIKDLRVRTENLVDQLRDKRFDRLLDRVRRLDECLHVHVRRQQPLSRTEVETITSIMMALRQAGIEEVPAELRKRAREQARAATDSYGAPIAPTPTTASPVVFLIAPAAAGTSTLAQNLHDYGFDVRVFEDHDSALQALPDPPPNAFIARLHPGQAVADLCDVTQVLRERIPVSVPVLWVVDRADSEMRLNILRAGGDGCIQEPVPMASLAARLRKLIPAEDRPPHRVLLVNADPEVRKIRTAVLHDSGLVVESVDDPMQTVPAALQFVPEVVLVDYSLSTMDGLELAHLLRQEDALQTTPIVLLCEGHDLIENRHRLRQLELDYLLHPCSESDLLERVCLRASQYRSMTALCEAATRCRSTAKEDPVAETGIKDESEFESAAIPTPTLDAAGRRHWSIRIRDAVLGKKLFLMFQPMFPVSGNDAIERYEVLLRIREDNGDVSLPSETLAMAEQLGMRVLLDRWVIDTALAMLATHRKTSPNTTFFLKVTGDTIQDDRFLDWLEETLHRRALDPGSVVVQIREGDAATQRQRTQDMIRRLREQGMAVALEHFGLRTTSFELLKSYDVDFVKLDRALVQGLADGANTAPAILTLLHQIRARGVTIIVPYIENADSLTKLWNERVDLLQGNFLHEPDLRLAQDPVP